jgi:hypothetical protein
MAIFRGVGYFYFHMPEGTEKQQRKRKQANTHARNNNKIKGTKQNRKNTNGNLQCDHVQTKLSRFLQEYENKNILHTLRWPCRPKHVVKDSGNQHNKAVRRRKHNLQNQLNNTVQQDAKI